MNDYGQTTEKLVRYHHEAEVQRQLPRGAWRVELARVLRSLAERLERPLPPTLHDDRHMRA